LVRVVDIQMVHTDDDPVNWLEFRKLIRLVKQLDARLGDAFEAVTRGDDTQADFWDEHEEKLNRHQRAIRRLEKRIEVLEKQ